MDPSYFNTDDLGVAYGFVEYEDIFRYRVDQLDNGARLIRDAIQQSLDYNNRKNQAFRSRLATDTTLAKEWFQMPGGGILQDLEEEHANPLPTQEFAAYDVAFPIRGAGDATGTDRVSRAMMTVGEANYKTQEANLKDKRWHVAYMLAALFRSTSYQFLDKGRRGYPGNGQLDIKPLANGDTTKYITQWGAGVEEDNHYLAQLNPIDEANNPFPAIHDELTHHITSDGIVDVYVPDDLRASIEGMPNFREPRDPQINYGSGESTVARGDKGIGDEYLGYIDSCNIILMRSLPAGYMFGHLRGQKPLAYREYPVASLQGLFQETHSPDGNHMETRFLRFGGYGVRNRTAALCYQVGASTYADPALSMQLA